jgi:hypothetical protein
LVLQEVVVPEPRAGDLLGKVSVSASATPTCVSSTVTFRRTFSPSRLGTK